MDTEDEIPFDAAPGLAIGLIGAGTLLLEILLTRIFSVTMWYHFAFVAITLALFGIAASGAFVSIAPRLFRSEWAMKQMGLAALLMGVTATISFLIDLRIPMVPFTPSGSSRASIPYLYFFAKFLVLSLPFFFSGLVIVLAFTHFPRRVHRTYFADLLGGGLGCVLVVPLLTEISGPSSVIFVSALALAASGLFFARARCRWAAIGATLGALGILVVVGMNEVSGFVRITRIKSYGKNTIQQVEKPKVYERWHPVSRVAVHPPSHYGPRDWFYAGSTPVQLPPTMAVTNDGGARTFIYEKMTQERREELFRHDLSDLAYHISSEPDVLVIGVGGGKDILSALTFGAGSVTGVELNPLMIDVVQKEFPDFSGAPYDDERVRIVIDEGRNYIASRDHLYDFIKISVTDTWTASALGAYALTENYLYTVQAIKDFVSHLEPGGYLSIIRWYPQESLRLVALSATALRELGSADPYAQMVMARGQKTLNLTIKNGVFSRKEVETLEQTVRASGLTWVGGGETQAVLEQAAESPADEVDHYHRLAAWSPERDSIARAVPFSIVPPTDDRPFFFSPVTLRAATLGEHYSFGSFTFQHGRALRLLTGLFKISMALALLFVIGPLVLRGRKLLHGVGTAMRLSASLYFLMLGFGYLLIEIPILQRFILFLGHPTYAVTVVLFSMLTSSGVGSLLAARRMLSTPGSVRLFFAGLLVLLLGTVTGLPFILHAAIGLPFGLRVLIAIAVIVPVGLLLGIPFPLGIGALHAKAPGLVPWAWAINGAASVAAPVIAMILAITSGFSTALYVGVGCYLVAALLMLSRHISGLEQLRPLRSRT